jgi:predicted nucleic acid-binding protein
VKGIFDKQKNSQPEIQPSESNSIKDIFIEAAKQSKIDADGYILINEFAQTLKKLGVNWDEFSNFKKFLESHKSIIEFKPDTLYYAPAIKVKDELATQKLVKQEKSQSETHSIKINNIKNKSITEKSEQVDSLEQIIKSTDKIYMDTCVLMETPVEEFFEKANPILRAQKKEIIISTKVYKELRENARNPDHKDPEKQNRAKKGLNVLSSSENEIRIDGENDDGKRIADNIFLAIFSIHRNEHKMLLITCDFCLAEDILNLNKSKSVRGKKCMVYWIDRHNKHWNGKLLSDVKQLP